MVPWYRGACQDISMPDEDEGSVRVPIGFPAGLYEWLRQYSFQNRMPMAAVVRQALVEYRDRHEPQLRLPWNEGGQA